MHRGPDSKVSAGVSECTWSRHPYRYTVWSREDIRCSFSKAQWLLSYEFVWLLWKYFLFCFSRCLLQNPCPALYDIVCSFFEQLKIITIQRQTFGSSKFNFQNLNTSTLVHSDFFAYLIPTQDKNQPKAGFCPSGFIIFCQLKKLGTYQDVQTSHRGCSTAQKYGQNPLVSSCTFFVQIYLFPFEEQ